MGAFSPLLLRELRSLVKLRPHPMHNRTKNNTSSWQISAGIEVSAKMRGINATSQGMKPPNFAYHPCKTREAGGVLRLRSAFQFIKLLFEIVIGE